MHRGRLQILASCLRGNFGIVLVTFALTYVARELTSPLLPRYLEALGARPEIIGGIFSAATFIWVATQLAGGLIADRHDRRLLIVACTMIMGLAMIPMAVAHSWRLALLGLALYFAAMIYQPALAALTADSLPYEVRGLGYSLLQMIPEPLGILAMLAAGMLVRRGGLLGGMRRAFMIAALLYIAAGVLRMRLRDDPKARRGRVRRVIPSLRGDAGALVAINGIIGLAAGLCGTFYVLYAVHQCGVEDAAWPLVTAAGVAASLAGSPIGGALADLGGRQAALLAATFPYVIGTAVFVKARGLEGVIIGYVLLSLSSALSQPALNALKADVSPPEVRGALMAAYNAAWGVAYAVGCALGGVVFARMPAAPFLASIPLWLAGMVAAGLISRRAAGY